MNSQKQKIRKNKIKPNKKNKIKLKKQNRNIFWKMFDIFGAFLSIFVKFRCSWNLCLYHPVPTQLQRQRLTVFFLSRAMRKESLLWLLHDLKKELRAALKTLPLIIKLPALKASLLAFSSSLVDSLIQSTHRDLGLRLAFHGSSWIQSFHRPKGKGHLLHNVWAQKQPPPNCHEPT